MKRTNTSNNGEHGGMMQCMECKKYFKECICFKSDGYIPKIWYCDRCYGRKEGLKQGYAKALNDVEKKIQSFNFKLYLADTGTFMYSAMKRALIAKLAKEKQ